MRKPGAILPIAFLAVAVQAALSGAAPARFVSRDAAPQSSSPLSIDAFLIRLDELAREIRASEAGSGPDIASRLPERWSVQYGADRLDIPSASIAAELNARISRPDDWISRRERLARRIEALGAEAAAITNPGETPNVAEARTMLAEVRSAREFRQAAETAWTERIRERVRRWFADLFQRIGLRADRSAFVARALVWVTALGALAALAMWLLRVLRTAGGMSPLRLESGVNAGEGSRDWVTRARAAAREGNAREAIRCAHRAMTLRLQEEGVWRVDDTRTPREYLRLVSREDGRRAALEQLTRQFERVWYAGVMPASGDAQDALARLRDLGCDLPVEPAT